MASWGGAHAEFACALGAQPKNDKAILLFFRTWGCVFSVCSTAHAFDSVPAGLVCILFGRPTGRHAQLATNSRFLYKSGQPDAKMPWGDNSWQRWEPDAWDDSHKGKGKGKGYGKSSRPSLSSALATVQSAIAEQAALASLAGVVGQRPPEDWQQGWPPHAASPLYPQAATAHFLGAPQAWQPQAQGCMHPPHQQPPAPRGEAAGLGQAILGSIASGVTQTGIQLGTLAVGALSSAVRAAIRGRSPPSGTVSSSSGERGARARSEGSAGDSLADRIGAAMEEDGQRDVDASREMMIRRLADQVAALQAENRRLRRTDDPTRRNAPAQGKAKLNVDTDTDLEGETPRWASRLVTELLQRAVDDDGQHKRRRTTDGGLELPAESPAAEPHDDMDSPAPDPPRARACGKRPAKASMALADLPDEVTPEVHARFYEWLGASSKAKATVGIDEWVKVAARKWGHAEWQRRAGAAGLRRLPASKEVLIQKLLRQHLTLAAGPDLATS